MTTSSSYFGLIPTHFKIDKPNYICRLNFALSDLHLLLSLATIPNVIKRSFAVRYGTPVGVGMLVGVVWGINKMLGHIDRMVYDLPISPLTHVYSCLLYTSRFV